MSENIQNNQPKYQPQIDNGGTKICKHCQSEIPKKAKICPVCKKKQGGILKWIIIVIVALVIIGAIAGGQDDQVNKVDTPSSSPNNLPESSAPASNTEETEPSSTEDSEKTIFHLGETAEYKDVQVTMTNITESEGSDFNTPADGNVFVLAEFEIINNSDKELTISSMLSFDAYQDGYSTGYSLTALLENDGEQLDGTIAPGKKMKGCIGYEIPSDYKELEINLSLNVWSSQKIVFVYEK